MPDKVLHMVSIVKYRCVYTKCSRSYDQITIQTAILEVKTNNLETSTCIFLISSSNYNHNCNS